MIKVLIADDNERLSKILCEFINEQSDMECIGIADSGKQCIQMIKESDPDVVILDIVMPETDGLGVLNELGGLQNKPVIIITSAIYTEKTVQLSLQLGAEYFFRKPYDLYDVVKRIQEYVKDEPKLKNKDISNHSTVEIDEMLSSMGIPKNSKGFIYLKDIINLYLALHNIKLNNAYKNIACKYKSNWRTIEKAIRRAIISGHENQTTVYSELYGRDIPSTLDFIDIFIDKCR